MDDHAQGFITTGNAFNDPSGLALLLMQILIILITCRIISIPFSYIHQPSVIAEVVGGILLGPTALGRWSWFRNTIFPPASMGPLKALADLGLVLFMLLIGLEMDLIMVKKNAKNSFIISVVGFAAPFALSVGVSFFLYNFIPFKEVKPEFYKFLLFIGVAMSVTALPVLARILTEKKLAQSRIGVIILSAASVDDAMCWILLALIIALIGSTGPIISLYIFLSTFAFVLVMFLVVSPLMLKLLRHFDQVNPNSDGVAQISQPMVVAAFLLTISTSFITNSIGIHTIFGGFVTGLILPRENGFAVALTHRIEDFVSLILLPLVIKTLIIIVFHCIWFKDRYRIFKHGNSLGSIFPGVCCCRNG